MRTLEQRGVRVVVQTNSLAATDVAAVHTGYMRYRKDLLRAGVELYETKRLADSDAGRRQISVTGSSGASLHTKAIIVDRPVGVHRLHEHRSARRT